MTVFVCLLLFVLVLAVLSVRLSNARHDRSRIRRRVERVAHDVAGSM